MGRRKKSAQDSSLKKDTFEESPSPKKNNLKRKFPASSPRSSGSKMNKDPVQSQDKKKRGRPKKTDAEKSVLSKKNEKSDKEIVDKPFRCAICGEQFELGDYLATHIKSHKGEKSIGHDSDSSTDVFECATCSKKFSTKKLLKCHIKKSHGPDASSKVRAYQCHLCDKAYPRADTLKRHILSFHENKRLYKCDVCQKSFKGHIRDHMRTHAEKDDKPYGCHQCGARFNQRSQLTVHMRVHTGERPYSCKICSRSFSHSTALKLHLRMHTGEKPHICKLCKKTFAQLPHLKKHMLCVHNTDRPYYCECCENFFKVKSEYQEHVDKAHPGVFPQDLVGITVIPVEEATLPPEGEAEPTEQTTAPSSQTMPLEKIRTLLALLLKKISTTGRLKKLGFGTRLIDDVLKESIVSSGRDPVQADKDINERDMLLGNIKILLDWTIPEEYMKYFKEEKKSVEEILEELSA